MTIKKVVDRFETKPYGWGLGSIEVVLGWLVGNGKVALNVDATPVARTEAAALIRKTRESTSMSLLRRRKRTTRRRSPRSGGSAPTSSTRELFRATPLNWLGSAGTSSHPGATNSKT